MWAQIFGSPMASGDNINIITLARGEIMLRMVKLRGAQLNQCLPALVKSPRNARWCMRYHAKHAIHEPTQVGARR